MMRREGDRVLFDISKGEFDLLLMLLGYAYGKASRDECGPLELMPALRSRNILRLANAINEGNPEYTPYEIPPEGA